MTDFRVELSIPPYEGGARELDWEGDVGRWSLSEKEEGEVKWTQAIAPSPDDLSFLATLFLLKDAPDPTASVRLSPGELAYLHASKHSSPSILASLCDICGLHWIVFEVEQGAWHRYGRSCDFAWSRGKAVDSQSDKLLARLLASKG